MRPWLAAALLLIPVAASSTLAILLDAWEAGGPHAADLEPTDDAYVWADGARRGSDLQRYNFGSQQTLLLTGRWNTSKPEQIVSTIYLKFDTSNLRAESIIRAELRLYASRVSTKNPKTINLHTSRNPGWTESSLTFDNAPPFRTPENASATITAPERWYRWDTTLYARERGSQPLVLVLIFDRLIQDAEEDIEFNSKEAPQNHPTLRIEYTGPPPPQPIPRLLLYPLTGLAIGATGILTTLLYQSRTKPAGRRRRKKPGAS